MITRARAAYHDIIITSTLVYLYVLLLMYYYSREYMQLLSTVDLIIASAIAHRVHAQNSRAAPRLIFKIDHNHIIIPCRSILSIGTVSYPRNTLQRPLGV